MSSSRKSVTFSASFLASSMISLTLLIAEACCLIVVIFLEMFNAACVLLNVVRDCLFNLSVYFCIGVSCTDKTSSTPFSINSSQTLGYKSSVNFTIALGDIFFIFSDLKENIEGTIFNSIKISAKISPKSLNLLFSFFIEVHGEVRGRSENFWLAKFDLSIMVS